MSSDTHFYTYHDYFSDPVSDTDCLTLTDVLKGYDTGVTQDSEGLDFSSSFLYIDEVETSENEKSTLPADSEDSDDETDKDKNASAKRGAKNKHIASIYHSDITGKRGPLLFKQEIEYVNNIGDDVTIPPMSYFSEILPLDARLVSSISQEYFSYGKSLMPQSEEKRLSCGLEFLDDWEFLCKRRGVYVRPRDYYTDGNYSPQPINFDSLSFDITYGGLRTPVSPASMKIVYSQLPCVDDRGHFYYCLMPSMVEFYYVAYAEGNSPIYDHSKKIAEHTIRCEPVWVGSSEDDSSSIYKFSEINTEEFSFTNSTKCYPAPYRNYYDHHLWMDLVQSKCVTYKESSTYSHSDNGVVKNTQKMELSNGVIKNTRDYTEEGHLGDYKPPAPKMMEVKHREPCSSKYGHTTHKNGFVVHDMPPLTVESPFFHDYDDIEALARELSWKYRNPTKKYSATFNGVYPVNVGWPIRVSDISNAAGVIFPEGPDVARISSYEISKSEDNVTTTIDIETM